MSRLPCSGLTCGALLPRERSPLRSRDRKSTRLKSSHMSTSYAVFCLKKKIHHCRKFFRKTICSNTDHTTHTPSDLSKCKIIISTHHQNILWFVTQNLPALVHVPTCFFYTMNIFNFISKSYCWCSTDIATRSSLNIIQYYRL